MAPRSKKNAYTMRQMTIAEWYLVSDNPKQRDTVSRARTQKCLHAYDADHQLVHAAAMPNGKLIKLDGHTRGWLYANQGQPGVPIVRGLPCRFPL